MTLQRMLSRLMSPCIPALSRPCHARRGKLTILLAFVLAVRLLLNGAPAAATTNPATLLTYPMPQGCTGGSYGVHGIFALGFGPDSNLYGNTAMSNCELQINPSSGAFTTYPDTLGGGEIFSYLAHGSRLYIAGYGLYAPLMSFDPSQPWQLHVNPKEYDWTTPTGTWDHNQWRAFGAVSGPDGKLYFGGCNGYNHPYGSIVVWDPNTDNIQFFDQPVQGQSVQQLVTANGYVVGGTSVTDCEEPPSPAAPSAELFLWDTHAQANVFQTVPVANAKAIWSLGTAPNGKVYGVADSTPFVFDPVSHAVTILSGSVGGPSGALYPMPDGTMWGVSQTGIYKIDTTTNAVSVVVPWSSSFVNAQSVVLHNGILYYARADSSGNSNVIWAYTVPSSGGATPTATSSAQQTATPAPPTATAVSNVCPSGWNCADIGNPSPSGGQALSNGAWTVQGGGTDIWGTSDHFHAVWQTLNGDGGITAHVTSQTNTDAWAKAGLMLRASTDPASAYYAAYVTPGSGISIQYRASSGALAVQAANIAGSTTPAYLKVGRVGNAYTAYTSTDGVNWTQVTGSNVTLSLPGSALASLAVTSHNNGTLSTATLDTVNLSSATPPTSTPIPPTSTATPPPHITISNCGSASASPATVQQGGTETFMTTASSDQNLTNANTQFDVYDSSGAHTYNAAINPSIFPPNSPQTFVRNWTVPTTQTSGTYRLHFSVSTASGTVLAAQDCTTFVVNASASNTATPASTALAATATPVSTSTPTPGPATCPNGWSCADIGSPSLSGSQTLSGGTWTVQGSGRDIWGSSDQFHDVWQTLSGNGLVSARITGLTGGDPYWAKAGVMLRDSSSANAPFFALYATSANGFAVQYRPSAGANVVALTAAPGVVPTYPMYLQITRAGNFYTAATSPDGVKWTPLGASVIVTMGSTVQAGLAVTAHDVTLMSTATFDHVSL